jgi:hypothetical protein
MFAIWYRVSATGRWYLSACEPLHERQSADQVAAVIAEALQRGGHEAAQSLVCGDGQMPAGVLFGLAEQLREVDTSAMKEGYSEEVRAAMERWRHNHQASGEATIYLTPPEGYDQTISDTAAAIAGQMQNTGSYNGAPLPYWNANASAASSVPSRLICRSCGGENGHSLGCPSRGGAWPR